MRFWFRAMTVESRQRVGRESKVTYIRASDYCGAHRLAPLSRLKDFVTISINSQALQSVNIDIEYSKTEMTSSINLTVPILSETRSLVYLPTWARARERYQCLSRRFRGITREASSIEDKDGYLDRECLSW
jgi:hypothetical protein